MSGLGQNDTAVAWRRGCVRTVVLGARRPVLGSLLVIKIGGSLLSRPGWPALLAALVATRPPRPCCLVVGGGAVVEGLRAIDQATPQPAAVMHELAIDAMRLTARLVAGAVRLPLATTPPDAHGVVVLDVPAWLAVGSRATSLPADWQVTSDAIAARVAVVHGGQLLLAKSVPPPPCPESADLLGALAAAGWVDNYFPAAAASLTTIEWAAPV